ncbi:MAG: hypothetical protein WA865_12760, partial [Spirulinaceae cyanobacterium]
STRKIDFALKSLPPNVTTLAGNFILGTTFLPSSSPDENGKQRKIGLSALKMGRGVGAATGFSGVSQGPSLTLDATGITGFSILTYAKYHRCSLVPLP